MLICCLFIELINDFGLRLFTQRSRRTRDASLKIHVVCASFHSCGRHMLPARRLVLRNVYVCMHVLFSCAFYYAFVVFRSFGVQELHCHCLHPDRSVVGFQACFYLRCKRHKKARSHAGLAHVHWYTSSSATSISASRIPRWLTGLCLSEPLLWDIGRERRREFYLVGERD